MGTHLRVLSESHTMNTNMTGFRWFSKNSCVLVLWTNVASALEGLTHTHLIWLKRLTTIQSIFPQLFTLSVNFGYVVTYQLQLVEETELPD